MRHLYYRDQKMKAAARAALAGCLLLLAGARAAGAAGAPLVTVDVTPAAAAPGDEIHLQPRFADAATERALSRRPRAVTLTAASSGASLKAHLAPAGPERYRIGPSLPPGEYRVGYVWPGSSGAVAAETALLVRPALEVALAPDPVQGRHLALTIRNGSAAGITASATVDMVGSRADSITNIALEGGQSLTLPIANVVALDRPLSVPLPVSVSVTTPSSRATWQGNVTFWSAGKTWGPALTLDSAQEWTGSGAWGGADDLAATLWARYDEHRLYLRAYVRDDRHVAGGSPADGDGIRFVVDPSWSRARAARGAVFTLGDTPGGPRLEHENSRGGPMALPSPTFTREGEVSRYEAAIPWEAIGLKTVRPGLSLGFALCVFDDDGDGVKGSLTYGDGLQQPRRADRYGTLTLLPAAPDA